MRVKIIIHDLLDKYYESQVSKKYQRYLNAKSKYDYFANIINAKKHFPISFSKKMKMYIKGFTSDCYYNYDLENNNMNNYINENIRWKSRRINGNYNLILDNKMLFYNVFSNYYSIPATIGSIIHGQIILNQKQISIEDLINELEKRDGIFIRPIENGGGRDIHVITKNNNDIYIDFRYISKNDLKKFVLEQKRVLLTEYIKQTGYASQIFNQTVNTVRIVVIKRKNEKHKIILAMHRFGTNKSIPCDNVSQGGVFSKINVDTGVMGKVGSYLNCDFLDTHPDTGVLINGIKIPNWDKIKKELLPPLQNFPDIYYISFDVAIMEKGFYVIEANASTGIMFIQKYGGLKNTELDDFFKERGIG